MGAKLMKHEYLRTRSAVGLIFGASIGLAVLGTLLGKTGWPFLSQLGTIMAVIGIVLVLPATQFYLAVDYWRSSFRRTGYFTQTLPIAGGTIFRVKLLWGIAVTLLAGLLVAALGLFFIRFGLSGLGIPGDEVFSQLLQAWHIARDNWPWWVMVLSLLFIGVMVILNLVLFYFAATIGSQEPLNRHGIGGPILVGVLGYMAQQILFFVAIIAVPFGIDISSGAMSLVSVNWLSELINNTDVQLLPTGFLAVVLIVPAVMIIWSYRSWKNRISLA